MALTDKEFTVGGTKYRVQKLNAWAAVKFIRNTRAELGETVDVAMLDTILNAETTRQADERASEVAATLVNVLFKLSEEFERNLMARMFETVRFTNAAAVSPQKLAGAEDQAFTDPFDAYEVLARCLAVNFSGSLRRVDSLLKGGIPDSLQSPRSE